MTIVSVFEVFLWPKWQKKNRKNNLMFCWDKPGYHRIKSQPAMQYFICLNINEKLHKARILSGLTIYNYEDMVMTWRLNRNCLTKEIHIQFSKCALASTGKRACREWVLFYCGAHSPVWEARMT